ncbi:LytR/AlgR family response regulator transcription factor [Tenacibaculum amylolyticum]|uniref:LytR/AlgR family response regulator transcription factor n=1 Tax=Tenacibaculum amylolyticum TaxID=104269 RepID=UPI0038943497
MKKIYCLIIDDEPTSQEVLNQFVSDIDFLEIKKVCNNAIEAEEIMNKEKIDLLFLDINMPLISGLSFYKSLKNPPLVIFTTAYSEYALEGFDLDATDYLLKPFSFERFHKSVLKAKNILNKDNSQIVLKSNKKLFLLKLDELLYIESLGDYITVHTEHQKLIVYKTMNSMMGILPTHKFIRIHKSVIINFNKIDFIEGNQVVIKKNKLPIGQKFKLELLNKIKGI